MTYNNVIVSMIRLSCTHMCCECVFAFFKFSFITYVDSCDCHYSQATEQFYYKKPLNYSFFFFFGLSNRNVFYHSSEG